jgi:hypothetical protein
LAGPELQVADDPIALVEQAKHRDPLRHRSHPGQVAGRPRDVDRDRFIAFNFIALSGEVAARRGDQQRDQEKGQSRFHAWSGFHAS